MNRLPDNVAEMRAVRPIVWPAYAVAGICLIFALLVLIFNFWFNEELRRSQVQALELHNELSALHRQITAGRLAESDLIATDAQRTDVPGGQAVRRANRLYLALSDIDAPPQNKVYQAWIMRKGSSQFMPSVTFVPNKRIAVVRLPVDASVVSQIAVSIEPEGGSKRLSGKTVFTVAP